MMNANDEVDSQSDIQESAVTEHFDKASSFHSKSKFHFWMQSSEAIQDFNSIDREKEDEMVKNYLQTNSQEVYNQLYNLRETTLWHWAKRYAYLTFSAEDMFSDLCMVWINAIHKYQYEPKWVAVKNRAGNNILDEKGQPKMVFKRTPFNTFLYTSLRNYVINRIKHRYSRKRVDPVSKQPYIATMMSLDYVYGDGADCADKNGVFMHELVTSECSDSHVDNTHTTIKSDLGAEWLIRHIAKDDREIRNALQRFAYEPHYKWLTTACRVRSGMMPLRKADQKILQGSDLAVKQELLGKVDYWTGLISRYHSSKKNPEALEFRLMNYTIFSTKVKYEIMVNDRKVTDKVLKAIQQASYAIKSEA